jgi:hypothetical protein
VSPSSNQVEIVSRVINDNTKGQNVRSFHIHRIPLLNLPQIILDAIMLKGLEYTKALAISKIDDPDLVQQNVLLKRATTLSPSFWCAK